MLAKQSIVAALGENGLALPRLIEEALAANDRVKYRLTLLQLARRHADAPDQELPDLRAERNAAQIDEPRLDELPAACTRVAADEYRLPGAAAVLAAAERDIRAMLAPVVVAEGAVGSAALAAVTGRANVLLPPLLAHRDGFTAAELDAWAHGERERGDSLHLLVMDLHRLLNRLQQAVATEDLDGASVYDLAAEDRERVRAFMRGINRTTRLKFDHPGLGTTATRSGGRLVIQNDIGETDAHVLVVHVAADAVAVTYTDVHLQRLLFFQSLFQGHPVDWQDTRLVQDRQMATGLYHLAIGRYATTDPGRISGFLEFLGSRLVFLIDWNRARKQLRTLVGKSDAIRLLEWAAGQDVGHMGFLKLGGARAVFEALDFAAHGRSHFGQTLADLLGADRAERFMQFVLRTSTTELLAGRPDSLLHDELRAELLRQLRGTSEGLLDRVAEHAGLIVEIASAVRDALLALGCSEGQQIAEQLAARCKAWESEADRIVNDVREAARAAPESAYLQQLVQHADDVADDLEETAFLVTLLRRAGVSGSLVAELATLAGRLVAGSQELVKALATVRSLGPGATREDLRDFLEAIHRVGRIEHETDELKRRIAAELASDGASAREIHLTAQSAAGLELAGDHLQHAALYLRDQVLAQLTAH
ncbi:MAG TPA: DUF47 family protein [Steroidobacteraceae bacterium]|nr:DUF47 family protein [Steroidobacteraceae bacterium]